MGITADIVIIGMSYFSSRSLLWVLEQGRRPIYSPLPVELSWLVW